jgi:hypothetical protein
VCVWDEARAARLALGKSQSFGLGTQTHARKAGHDFSIIRVSNFRDPRPVGTSETSGQRTKDLGCSRFSLPGKIVTLPPLLYGLKVLTNPACEEEDYLAQLLDVRFAGQRVSRIAAHPTSFSLNTAIKGYTRPSIFEL